MSSFNSIYESLAVIVRFMGVIKLSFYCSLSGMRLFDNCCGVAVGNLNLSEDSS